MRRLLLLQLCLLLYITNGIYCRYRKIPGVAHYKIHRKPRNWWDAESHCRREEGYLAEVRSEGAFRALESLLAYYPDENLHLHSGFADTNIDGNLEWVNGGPVYIPGGWNAPWEGMQLPKFDRDNTCGIFGGFANANGGGLGLGPCEVLRPYICERQINYRRHLTYPFKKWLGKIFH